MTGASRPFRDIACVYWPHDRATLTPRARGARIRAHRLLEQFVTLHGEDANGAAGGQYPGQPAEQRHTARRVASPVLGQPGVSFVDTTHGWLARNTGAGGAVGVFAVECDELFEQAVSANASVEREE